MRHLLKMNQKPSYALRLIGLFFQFKPLIFAFGILMPLIAQSLILAQAPLPEDVSPYAASFVVSAVWGGIAQWKGRWI